MNSSNVCTGNLYKKSKTVDDWAEDDGFTATVNSTKYGSDFGDVSQLRDGSEHKEALHDDLNDQGAIDASNEDMESIHGGKEDALDNDSWNNSTGGAIKKRTTTKKNAKNKTAPGIVSGRETRSKAGTGKMTETADDAHKIEALKVTEQTEQKGEKEKGSVSTTAQKNQIAVFKPPTCTSSDIRKIVAKAVRKSKTKLSNNYAFNSKIQHFKITTDSALIKKIPEICPADPLIEISIPEFIWNDHDKTIAEDNMVKVRSRGAVQFVVLARSGHLAQESWDAPGIDLVRDFASFATCHIAELKLEFGAVLRWTNPWGSVAVVGLDTSDLELLNKFRTFFTTLRFQHQYFNTFPKDAMTNDFGISILLKSDLREFKEQFLAEALFARNQLFGTLDTLQAETYTAADTTRQGVSKNGWRNVLLDGNDVFLESLSKFTASHWFSIGPASVQIHGGERRAETEFEIELRNKRRHFNMPYGQSLSNSAKTAINNSYRADQQELAKNPIARAASAYPQQSGAKAPLHKKRK